MAFTFGFYNSLNHDRRYDAKQMAQFLDGLISDGVYGTVGELFKPKISSIANTVIIGSGRAWFNHTWNYNDADLPITGSVPNSAYNRYDAIVIDVNSNVNSRQNQILYVTGTASSSPTKPAMIRTSEHNQYPICYIYKRAGVSSIVQNDIEYTVGTSECPYVESSMTDTKNIAQVDNGDTASKSYTDGEYLLWHDELYKVVGGVVKGADFKAYPASGYNIRRTTIADEMTNSISLLSSVSATSSRGVTSAGIYAALGNRTKIETSSPTSGSSNLITSGQVYTALGNRTKIETSSPTSGSSNLITSGQVYTALDTKMDKNSLVILDVKLADWNWSGNASLTWQDFNLPTNAKIISVTNVFELDGGTDSEKYKSLSQYYRFTLTLSNASTSTSAATKHILFGSVEKNSTQTITGTLHWYARILYLK